MAIKSCRDMISLLDDERMAVIEDLPVDDLREVILYFSMAFHDLSDMEELTMMDSTGRGDRQKLKNAFEGAKEHAQLCLDRFGELTQRREWPE